MNSEREWELVKGIASRQGNQDSLIPFLYDNKDILTIQSASAAILTISLTPSNVSEHKDLLTEIYHCLDKFSADFGFTDIFRISLLQNLLFPEEP